MLTVNTLHRLSPTLSRTIPTISKSCAKSTGISHSRSFSFATHTKKSVVPVIDLSGTFTDPKQKQRVALEIDEACRNIGFLTIVGHQIPDSHIQQVWKVTHDYFDLPVEQKRKIVMTDSYPYGYNGYAEENLSSGYGEQGHPDLKECFAIGPYNPRAGMPPIQWPSHPTDMQRLWLEYYQNMEKLSSHLLSLFALALKLPENWFDNKIDYHRSSLRALNYPEQKKAPEPGQVRAGAHTDYGSLTILLQDSVGGLQVRDRSNVWHDVATTPSSFIINLGDLMARWTNDEWVSTLHRVVNVAPKTPSSTGQFVSPPRRQSMAFFHNINHDHIVTCIPSCTNANKPPRYEPIAAWDLLMQKHLQSVGSKKE